MTDKLTLSTMKDPPSTEVPPPQDSAKGELAPMGMSTPGIQDDQVAQSQKDYVALLFSKYRASLYRYLTRLVHADDAAELVQEAYYRLLRHGETIQIEAMARSFLFHTATNLARDHRRRRMSHRVEKHVQLEDQEIVAENAGPDVYLAGEQVRILLQRAIADLPQDTRTVFLLHRFRDLSYPQIAKVMSLSARTVARKMTEAVEHLSSVLGQAI